MNLDNIKPYIRKIIDAHRDAINYNDVDAITELNKIRSYFDKHVLSKQLTVVVADAIREHLDEQLCITTEKSEWIYEGSLYQIVSIIINGTTPSHFSNITSDEFIAMRKEFKQFKKEIKGELEDEIRRNRNNIKK